MGFHVPHRGVHGVEIVAVEHIDGGADHLQMAELLRRHVQEQVLDLLILDPHTLGQVLQGGFQFPLRAAQLFLQQRGVVGIRPVHPDGVEILLFVLEHGVSSLQNRVPP